MCVFVTVTSLRIVSDGNKEATYLLTYTQLHGFLADRTNGRAYATVLRLSVCLSVCDVMYCG